MRFHLTNILLEKIVQVGFPAAFQQSLTSFSNVIVQSYINSFGTAAMAGYSSTIRIDGFLQLPLQVLIWQSQLLWVKIWGQNNINVSVKE